MNATQRIKAKAKYLTTIERLYALLGDKEHEGVSYMDVAKTIDVPSNALLNVKTLLVDLGVLKASIVVNPIVNGKRIAGRRATWQLIEPLEEAMRRVSEWEALGEPWEYDKRKGYAPKFSSRPKAREAVAVAVEEEIPVTIAANEKEETRAIAGPEPEKAFSALAALRKDEPRALIEAAKQYMDRHKAVEREYQSLVTMGLNVDRDLFLQSISLPRDEFMEAVSLVVPLVVELESRVERLSTKVGDLQERTKDYATLKSNYERLQKTWNERVAEKVRSA